MTRRHILEALRNGEIALDEARQAVLFPGRCNGGEVMAVPAHSEPAELGTGPGAVDRLQGELVKSLAAALYMPEDEIDLDLPFTDMGLDSIVGVEWINQIGKQYGIKVPASKVYDHPTLPKFAAYLHGVIAKEGRPPAAARTVRAEALPSPAARPREEPRPPLSEGKPGGIAIVGMSGRYPGAPDLPRFWDNLARGANSIREIPRDRWDAGDYYDPEPGKPGKIYCKWLGALDGIDRFDAPFFMISPAEAEGMDPQHRIFLEEAYRAFEDAGYSPHALSNTKCGVYMGIMSSEYIHLLSRQQTSGLNTGNSFSIAAARVPYYLNLKGPAIPIDTACSSSLVAAHLACQALRNGEIGMALVGGVTLYLTPASYVGMCAAGMLSADGQCKSFDDGADGFVPGEGVGAVVLKRLEDARRDGDVIHGVIIGSGINHDGRTNGITAPSVTSQIELERDVYKRFGIDPGTIDYVETHGTGTKLGDPIELEALTTVFRELTPRRGFCGIGSVKSNIGHTSAAAGVAGIHKMLLCLKHGKLVPTLNFRRPNVHCDFDDSPFYVNTEVKPWEPREGRPRRAAVSSFGFSGTNAHLVIEEYPGYAGHRPPVPALPSSRPALIVLSAKDEGRLTEVVRNLRDHLARGPGDLAFGIDDLAYTLQVGREAMEERIALTAGSVEELARKLDRWLREGSAAPGVWRGRVPRVRGKLALFEAEGDLADPARLLELWVTGLIVDWSRFRGATRSRRVSLPAYPFAGERYWVPESPDPAPVAEKRVETPSRISLNDPAKAWNFLSSPVPPVRLPVPRKLRPLAPGSVAEAVSAPVELVDHGNGIHSIRVNPGTGRDRLSKETASSLARGFRTIRDRADAKVVLLFGGDACFLPDRAEEGGPIEEEVARLAPDCEIPVIAAMKGQASGLGWLTGCLCDFMVCAEEGLYHRPEAGLGREARTVCEVMADRFGHEIAEELLSSSRALTGRELKEKGASFPIVPRHEVDDCAMRLAREIAQAPREALVQLKRHLAAGPASPLLSGEAQPGWGELGPGAAPDPGEPTATETFADVVRLEAYPNGVVLLTLRDTQSKNAFSEALARGVAEAFERIRSAPGYKAVVLTGFGNYFACGGTKEALLAIQAGQAKFTDSTVSSLPLECEIPVLAAMQGHGIGAGWAMGMFCDHVFFSEESTYHSPYMRYGFTPGAGSTLILPERLGRDLGWEILFSAREYKGHELKSRGMGAPVLPRSGVVAAALRMAHGLALYPRESLMRWKAERSRRLRAEIAPAYAREVALHEKTFVGSREVRERIERHFGPGPAASVAPANESESSPGDMVVLRPIIHTLRETLASELHTKPDKIDVEVPFIEMGLDSINNVTWVRGLNQRYGLSLGAAEVYSHPTVATFAAHILRQGRLRGLFLPEKKGEGGAPAPAARQAPASPEEPGRRERGAEEGGRKAGRRAGSRDIAVIGMSGQFPKARNIAEFWDNLARGRDCISTIPATRWPIEAYYDADPRVPGKTCCKWMGALDDMDKFDPLFFNISPLEAESMDPQQRLFLESCWACIEDAGCDPAGLSGSRCGVFAGCGPGDYGLSVDSDGMDASALMGGSTAILAARISYLLNLRGPSMALDTACSSSLVAIASACDSLILEASDLALAGGVSVMSGPMMHIMASKAGMLSPDGRCFTFDRRANGFVPGEGVGVLLLKRLEDAERDGDRIQGVIRGWGVNQDGKTNGITAPSGDAQARLERDVYERHGLNPEGIQLVEAHGTGTKLGDPIEVEGLKAAFGALTRKERFCALGSVKSNIGHLLAASGAAAAIKVLLALKHRKLPPTIHFEALNEHILLDGSPFYVNTACAEWEAPEGRARRAAVSGFGFSGTNAHVVIEEYREPAGRTDGPAGPAMIVLSAKNRERLRDAAQNLVRHLSVEGAPPHDSLGEIAYTLQVGRSAMAERLGLTAQSLDELRDKLQAFLAGEEAQGVYAGNAKRRHDASSGAAADEAVREAMEKWLAAGDHAKLLEVWVAGHDIDWSRLYGKSRPRRVGLPTYPFARERYWKERKYRLAEERSPIAPEKGSSVERGLPVRPPERTDLLEGMRSRLKQLLGETLNLAVDRIEANEALESYGIDSILVGRLSQKLEPVFPEVSKTLWFEVQTLGQLAEALADDFPQESLRWVFPEGDETSPADGVEAAGAGIPAPVFAAPASTGGPRREIGEGGVPGRDQEPIAIIGITGRYAQAETLDALWENLKSGKDCVTEIPPGRWAMEGFFQADPEEAIRQGKSYSKWGSFLEGFSEFDPLFFNISPLEALGMDPQERLFLQSSWEVLEAAGYTRARLAETIGGGVGVFAGVTKTGFDQYRADWRRQGEAVTPYTSFGSVANRVSYALDLKGPSMPIDTMCSSSLTAVHEACEQLRRGACRMAIAGGVNLYLHPSSYIGLCARRMLSRDGKCRSFGEGGNGFVPGEGVGVVLLKPLARALEDGDPIHAVIRGSSVNHGGKTNGYTVPNPAAQRGVIRDALDKAGIGARRVSYLEAHGTGTELGDPIEMSGLAQAFARDTADTGFCALGSAKSNLGHLEAAAGIAGLSKVVLQMRHGKLAPSLHAGVLNPNIPFAKTPFVVQRELAEWRRPEEGPRIAGISSFGAGGANAHVVVEEPPASTPRPDREGPVLVVLSARTGERLRAYARKLGDFLDGQTASEGPRLDDLAFTLQIGREAMEERAGFVAASLPELRGKLKAFAETPDAAEGCFYGRVLRGGPSGEFYGDEDMAPTIEAWLRKGKLGRIAELWVRGGAVDWEKLYGGDLPRRIALPTYPFAKETYWVEIKPERGTGAGSLHPLVHANASDLTGLRFRSVFSGNEFFVADHRVNGRKVLPGVAYLEMARFAARQAGGGSSDRPVGARIRHAVWARPISVEGSGKTVDIRLADAGEDGLSFSIETAGEGGEASLHSQGYVSDGGSREAPVLDLERLRADISERLLDRGQCYRAFASMGMDYGPGYQGIEEVAVGAGQVLARLALPPSAARDGYVLHPSLMDSALQACIGLSLSDPGEGGDRAPALVPYALDELEIHGRCASRMWAWIRPSPGPAEAAASKLDIDLCDEGGRVAVSLRGLSFRRFEGGMEPEEDDGGMPLILSPEWTDAAVSPGAPAVEYAGRRVMLCGMEALSPVALESAWPGTSCLRLRGGEKGMERGFEEASVHAFEVVRDFLGARAPKGRRLVQIVIPSGADGQLWGGLSGLLKTARLENPELVGQVIAVDPREAEAALLRKLEEDSRCPDDIQIRHEGGARQVLSWRETDVPASAPAPWKDGGVYLLTGGAGGLGMIFAEAIAKQTRGARLILCGRSDVGPEMQERLRVLEEGGARVAYRKADVGQIQDVERLIADIQGEFGALHGILHGAGVVQDRLLVNKTADEFRRVLAPKVGGTICLDRASRDVDLDFFLLFSAGAGVLGNPGQADYATANAFLDEFARHRNGLVAAGRRRGATLAVDWPLWKAGGMTMDEAAVAAMREKLGMTPLDAADGIAALCRAFATGKDQAWVISGDRRRLRAALLGKASKGTETPARNPGREPAPADEARLEEKTVAYFRELLSSTLRVPLPRIHADGVMSDLGIDSVVVMNLTARLEKSFGPLSKTLFFEHPTLRALARHFIGAHAGKLRQLFSPGGAGGRDDGPLPAPEALPGTAWPRKAPSEQAAPDTILPGEPRPSGALDIAVIGVSGRYPQAGNLDEFWKVLSEGRDCITEVPPDRWNWRDYYSDDPSLAKGHSSKWGGFLDDVDKFDPQFFHISPRIAPYLDPQERLILEEAWKALEDAGYRREDLQQGAGGEAWSPVGVYIGAMYGEYQLFGAEASLSGRRLGFAGNLASIANRLSYVLNLHGPSMMVDTMCSSSLTCIHLACQDLAAGRTNYGIAGGVNVSIHPNKYLMLSGGQFLSSSGRCESFGEGGAGYIPSEGVGVVLLKRLSDAERDGDHIYGVIKGSAVNHGGRTHGYSVPNPRAQERVIAQALKEARVDPRAVSYVEAHGTGTKLGDPIEIAGLAKAFGREPGGPRCWIGSAKSNIGHCEAAAGIAGLTKVLLQMRHGQIAPSLHSRTLNPHIDFASTPFEVNQVLREWDRPPASGGPGPRIAGVSSFGAGGSNAHIVVEEYRGGNSAAPSASDGVRHAALIVLSAKSGERLAEVARNLGRHLEASGDASPERLRNLAYTLQVGREALEERLGFAASSIGELKEKLDRFLHDPACAAGMARGRVDDGQGTGGSLAADPASQEAVREWLEKGDASKLLERWANGGAIDWKRLYGDGRPRRIGLPTYPFSRKRFWVEMGPGPEGAPAEPQARPLVPKESVPVAWGTAPAAKPRGVALAPLPVAAGSVGPAPAVPPAPLRAAPRAVERATEPARSAAPSRAPSASPQSLQGDLLSSLAQALFMEEHEIGPDKPFLDMGIDSIVGAEWVNAINKKYGLTIPASQVYEHPSLRRFTEFLHRQLQQPESALSDSAGAAPEKIAPAPSEAAPGKKGVVRAVRSGAGARATDVAIVGIAGRFPGGETLDEFWRLLRAGRTAFTGFPQDRGWDAAFSGQGAFLKEVDRFDPLFFQISPKEAVTMDPGERLFLQESWKAIEDAGIVPADLSGRRWGVFCGNGGDYSLRIKDAVGYSPHVTLAQVPSRVSHCLNLTGPSQSVDAGCASALLAIAQACDHLAMGKCEAALAGGVLIHSTPNLIVSASQVGLLAKEGRGGRALDRSAEGMTPGEAVGVVVLKPLADAVAAGDRIYGVIEGWGNNHNGKTNGMASPSADSAAALFSEVYDRYEIDPDGIGLVEANASGLPLADAAEVRALTRAFRQRTARRQFCALGSVENNVGHAFHASGMSHLMKVLLSLRHREIPPTPHADQADPALDLEQSPFFVNAEAIPWEAGSGRLRRAAVSSFGATGANVHLVIAEAPSVDVERAEPAMEASGSVLIPLSSKTASGLRQACRDLEASLRGEAGKETALRRLSANLLLRRTHFEHRGALVVADMGSLKSRLQEMAEGKEPAGAFLGVVDPARPSSPSLAPFARGKIDALAGKAAGSAEEMAVLADLFVQGVPLDMEACFSKAEKAPVSLPPYSFEKRRCWIDAPGRGGPIGKNHAPAPAAEKPIEPAPVLEILKGFLAEITDLSPDEIDPGATLSAYGVDSLLGMRLLNRVNARFGGGFDASLLVIETIGGVADEIARRGDPQAGEKASASGGTWMRPAFIESLEVEAGVGSDDSEAGWRQLESLIAHGVGVWKEGGNLCFEFLEKTQTRDSLERLAHRPKALQAVLEEGARYFPASEMQRFALHESEVNRRTTFNLCQGFRIEMPVNREALNDALDGLVRRHSIFRTAPRLIGRQWAQVVRDSLQVACREIEWAEADSRERFEAELAKFQKARNGALFDLGRPSLMDVYLVHNGKDLGAVFFHTHHFHADGFTLYLFQQELFRRYLALARSQPFEPPEPSAEYAHFALSQFAPERAAVARYWLDKLGGKKRGGVLRDRERPREGDPGKAGVIELPVDPALLERLQEFNRRNRTTLTQAVAAALAALLYRLTGESHPIQMVYNLRDRAEFEPLLGDFSASVPMVLALDGQSTWREIFRSYEAAMLEIQRHKHFDFSVLLEKDGIWGDVALDSNDRDAFGDVTGFAGRLLDLAMEDRPPVVPLLVCIVKTHGRMTVPLIYDQGRFSRRSIELVAESLLSLLGQMLRDVEMPLDSLEVPPELGERLEWGAPQPPESQGN